MVGGFKLVAQAFHFGRQFFIACRDPLNLVEALLSVPCGLHQVLHVKKAKSDSLTRYQDQVVKQNIPGLPSPDVLPLIQLSWSLRPLGFPHA